ncbi:RHS repeat domain-containing protein [uncultured Porphyromonas sp.]|uniref:RHS repeat domain-containing protein n=1 Tax=uncultured Porphyromonas sp. TaxID=159274 RepID=UPI0025831B99|nr:RHS repeat domain-containing protein [uncultured Porphyromonas sp.]
MLREVRLPYGKTVRFEYDALGRRTAKISVWGRSAYHRVTRFLWEGDVPLHEWTYEGSEPPKTNSRRRDIATIPRESHKPN